MSRIGEVQAEPAQQFLEHRVEAVGERLLSPERASNQLDVRRAKVRRRKQFQKLIHTRFDIRSERDAVNGRVHTRVARLDRDPMQLVVHADDVGVVRLLPVVIL